MARQCITCRRSSFKAASRSHSNIKTIRRQYVNIQNRWVDGKHVALCTSCIKTKKKQALKAKTPVVAKKK